jgi:hypothetical protein
VDPWYGLYGMMMLLAGRTFGGQWLRDADESSWKKYPDDGRMYVCSTSEASPHPWGWWPI